MSFKRTVLGLLLSSSDATFKTLLLLSGKLLSSGKKREARLSEIKDSGVLVCFFRLST